MRKGKRARRNVGTTTHKVDLTPKWAQLVPYFCRVLEDRAVPQKAKSAIKAELLRLAHFADKVNAQVRRSK